MAIFGPEHVGILIPEYISRRRETFSEYSFDQPLGDSEEEEDQGLLSWAYQIISWIFG